MLNIKPGEKVTVGVWNHLDAKKVLVAEKGGGNVLFRITSGTEEIARFEVPEANLEMQGSELVLTEELCSMIKKNL